jgi:hypothetical protein
MCRRIFLFNDESILCGRKFPLDRLTDNGWFVGGENLSATNRVVVTGAQTVLSAELSGGGFNTGQRD